MGRSFSTVLTIFPSHFHDFLKAISTTFAGLKCCEAIQKTEDTTLSILGCREKPAYVS